MVAQCPKCLTSSFEIHEHSLTNSAYRFNFISCSSCGMLFAALEYNHLGDQMQDILYRLTIIVQKIDQQTQDQAYAFGLKIDALETELSQIRYQLAQRA